MAEIKTQLSVHMENRPGALAELTRALVDAGVNLLGIDSVHCPTEKRMAVWKRVASDLPMDKLEAMIVPATLTELPQLGADILKGQVKGRVVVDLNG